MPGWLSVARDAMGRWAGHAGGGHAAGASVGRGSTEGTTSRGDYKAKRKPAMHEAFKVTRTSQGNWVYEKREPTKERRTTSAEIHAAVERIAVMPFFRNR